jgi:butyryl-CoA dehydrogenase
MATVLRRSLASLGAAAAKQQAAGSQLSLFNPSSEMLQLRQSVRAFAEQKVAPGARERDAKEKFDMGLFKQCGEMGLLGVTYGEILLQSEASFAKH